MRRLFTYLLLASSVIIVASCSSTADETDAAIDIAQTTATQPASNATATLAVPLNIETLDQQPSEFWILQGYGQVKPIPVSILGSSPQLDDDILVAEWTAFLSGVTTVNQVDFRPRPSYCPNGFIAGHEHNRKWREDVTWTVVPNNDVSESSARAIGGNSIRVLVDTGQDIFVDDWGAIEDSLVQAQTGVHNGVDLIGDGGIYGRYVPTEAKDC